MHRKPCSRPLRKGTGAVGGGSIALRPGCPRGRMELLRKKPRGPRGPPHRAYPFLRCRALTERSEHAYLKWEEPAQRCTTDEEHAPLCLLPPLVWSSGRQTWLRAVVWTYYTFKQAPSSFGPEPPCPHLASSDRAGGWCSLLLVLLLPCC